jgi:hypothetical protein
MLKIVIENSVAGIAFFIPFGRKYSFPKPVGHFWR